MGMVCRSFNVRGCLKTSPRLFSGGEEFKLVGFVYPNSKCPYERNLD